MIKKFIVLLIICGLAASVLISGSALTRVSAIFVDGEQIDDSGVSYIENGTSYVPLRTLADALGAESVEWKNGRAYVYSPGLELTAEPERAYFTANGRYFYVKGGVRLQNGRIMLPVRLICRVFGAEIGWDNEKKTINIETGGEPIKCGDEFYNEDEVYWLSRIIHAEASGESLEGKIAVGNVVLNRVQSPLFPDSVYNVIFDKGYGIQFTPAYSGGLKFTPSEEAEAAAKLALEGTDIVGESLYFSASSVAASSWAGRNRTYISKVGNHCFYA